MEKINKPAITEWVAALRSGNYQQGTEHLVQEGEDGKRYCCLGVACDIFADRVGLMLAVAESGEMEYWWTATPGGHASTGSSLPGPLVKFLGVAGRDPILQNGRSFIAMNDDWGWDFDQIADAIEREYLTEKPDA